MAIASACRLLLVNDSAVCSLDYLDDSVLFGNTASMKI